ncbi:TetR/AcrR family transcriptional regulator [Streptomyces sp. NPDC048448]|uniref:TetR/AcrR family transcriptional regulator n=1 Tax=Streptomyces sp. NPDC048448 TaxID=3365554 RepID=UPI00371CD2D7
MRTWAENDPKARLMARKREAIISAALAAFLDEGYGGSSVNRIAASAGVSITTLYRHFDSKGDLFVAVIQEACDTAAQTADPSWMELAPSEGLAEAGRELLEHILSEKQLALFRVVARDAGRFPELGLRYQQEIVGNRVGLFTRYLSQWPAELRSRVGDPVRAAHVFSALLQAEIVDAALLGGPVPDADAIRGRALEAGGDLLALVEAGRL